MKANTGSNETADGLSDKPLERWDQPLDMGIVIPTILLHLGCLAAPFYFSWSGLLIAVALYFVTACLGITLGYHRLLTHASFKTYRSIRYFLSLCGCLGFTGGPLRWVGTHRVHHADSDGGNDPHSPTHGLFWAHMKYVFHQEPESQNSYAAVKDLQKDPVMVAIEKWSPLPQLICFAILYLAGEYFSPGPFGKGLGLSWLIWGGFVRTIALYHAAGSVNSLAHCYGYRNFNTEDNSRNLWWIALITFGEGWHNNHHAQQRSAAHGMRWWEIDVTYLIIKAMEQVGLAWDVVEADRDFNAA